MFDEIDSTLPDVTPHVLLTPSVLTQGYFTFPLIGTDGRSISREPFRLRWTARRPNNGLPGAATQTIAELTVGIHNAVAFLAGTLSHSHRDLRLSHRRIMIESVPGGAEYRPAAELVS